MTPAVGGAVIGLTKTRKFGHPARAICLARLAAAIHCRATQNFPRLRDALTADPASVLVERPIVPTAIAGQESQLDCASSVRDPLHHVLIMPLRAPL
jgi:hypothetical protein